MKLIASEEGFSETLVYSSARSMLSEINIVLSEANVILMPDYVQRQRALCQLAIHISALIESFLDANRKLSGWIIN